MKNTNALALCPWNIKGSTFVPAQKRAVLTSLTVAIQYVENTSKDHIQLEGFPSLEVTVNALLDDLNSVSQKHLDVPQKFVPSLPGGGSEGGGERGDEPEEEGVGVLARDDEVDEGQHQEAVDEVADDAAGDVLAQAGEERPDVVHLDHLLRHKEHDTQRSIPAQRERRGKERGGEREGERERENDKERVVGVKGLYVRFFV